MGQRKRTASNIIIVAVLYCNLNAFLMMFSIPPIFPTFSSGVLPTHPLMVKFFNNFPVFTNGLGDANLSFLAVGSATPVIDPNTFVVESGQEIDLYEFYPQRLDEAHKRIALLVFPPSARPGLHQAIASKIRAHLNLRDSSPPLADVLLYFTAWPRSVEGYRARYSERNSSFVGKS